MLCEGSMTLRKYGLRTRSIWCGNTTYIHAQRGQHDTGKRQCLDEIGTGAAIALSDQEMHYLFSGSGCPPAASGRRGVGARGVGEGEGEG